jgi:hypothetical protein
MVARLTVVDSLEMTTQIFSGLNHLICCPFVIPMGVEGRNKRRIRKTFSTACPSGRRALELTAMLSFRTDAGRLPAVDRYGFLWFRLCSTINNHYK